MNYRLENNPGARSHGPQIVSEGFRFLESGTVDTHGTV